MLWFPLMINNRNIGRVEAVRRDEPQDVEGHYVYDYVVQRFRSPLNGKAEPEWDAMRWQGVVVHRYADGGFELMRKVLEAIHCPVSA